MAAIGIPRAKVRHGGMAGLERLLGTLRQRLFAAPAKSDLRGLSEHLQRDIGLLDSAPATKRR